MIYRIWNSDIMKTSWNFVFSIYLYPVEFFDFDESFFFFGFENIFCERIKNYRKIDRCHDDRKDWTSLIQIRMSCPPTGHINRVNEEVKCGPKRDPYGQPSKIFHTPPTFNWFRVQKVLNSKIQNPTQKKL